MVMRSSIISAFDVWESIEYVSAAIVIVGASGEALGEFTNFLGARESRDRKDLILKISTIILLVGLAIELAATMRVNFLAGLLINPRDLSQSQQLEISSSCSRFAGRNIHVRSQAMDLEAWRLAEEIIATLRAARLNVEDDTLSVTPFDGVAVGIQVAGPEQEGDLTSAIQRALRLAMGGAAMSTQDIPSPLPPDAKVVTILVGVKPLP
jgi:hypothetical protein